MSDSIKKYHEMMEEEAPKEKEFLLKSRYSRIESLLFIFLKQKDDKV